MDTKLINTAEAARRLGVTTITVARYVRQGKINPAERLPYGRGGYLFEPADVDALADKINPSRHLIAARALRNAADHWHGDYADEIAAWLRERADAVERCAEDA